MVESDPTICFNFEESMRDSPQFRTSLRTAEVNLEVLKRRYQNVQSLWSTVADTGRQFTTVMGLLTASLTELSTCFSDNDKVTGSAKKLIKMLEQCNEDLHEFVLSFKETQTRVLGFVTKFNPLQEISKSFTKATEDYETSLSRSLAQPKHKVLEDNEADNLCRCHLSQYKIAALDYVHAIKCMNLERNTNYLDFLQHFTTNYCKFITNSAAFVNDTTPWLEYVVQQRSDVQIQTEAELKRMECRHDLLKHHSTSTQSPSPTKANIEGYLFRKTHKKFKPWARRWFFIRGNQLLYCKKSDPSDVTCLEADLRICTAKSRPAEDRRFTFEMIAPERSHYLQAENASDLFLWCSALQTGWNRCGHTQSSSNSMVVSTFQQSSESPSEVNKKKLLIKQRQAAVKLIQSVPGNSCCCDCGADQPRWAAINNGVLLCIECSGVHRSFGVQVSKVKSLTLDQWEPFTVKLMQALGNLTVNRIFEASKPDVTAMSPAVDPLVRKTFVTKKWMQRNFLPQQNDSVQYSAGKHLIDSAKNGDVAGMLEALAFGAPANYSSDEDNGTTALILSILSDSVAGAELMLLNGADMNYQDNDGCTALLHACSLGHTHCVCQLLRRRANQKIEDKQGRTAYSVALESANADCVTLLRLAILDEDTRETECLLGDEMFQDVFQDFIQMAFQDFDIRHDDDPSNN